MTCYDNKGRSFILGRDYLNIIHRHDRETARVQSQWAKAQAKAGVRYPKPSKQLHSLPYAQLYIMLEYKLKLYGIRMIKQEESYSSQCPPVSESVSRVDAHKGNRKMRGLYVDGEKLYNADAVGAYNILRKYCAVSGKVISMPVSGLDNTEVIKAAV